MPVTILSDHDRARYARAFEAVAAKNFKQAEKYLNDVHDPVLKGHVRYHILMHPSYYATFRELRDWMADHHDNAGAPTIYRLAVQRQEVTLPPPKRPRARSLRTRIPKADAIQHHRSRAARDANAKARVAEIKKTIQTLVYKAQLDEARAFLASPDIDSQLDAVETDNARQWIAAGYYYKGRYKEAQYLAEKAAARSGNKVPLSHWYAGLMQWRQGDIKRAASHFEVVATSPATSGWTRAAGAYWAARANLILLNAEKVVSMLAIAADYPRSFYGLLAARALGEKALLRFDLPPLSRDKVASLLVVPEVRRAIALLELGRQADAEKELRLAYGRTSWRLDPALVALATVLNLPNTQYLIGLGAANYDKVARKSGVSQLPKGLEPRPYDAALYPMPPWEPKNGYEIDRAMLLAFTRQESRFLTQAYNPSGASGLMQILPSTAGYLMKDKSLASEAGRDRLFNPAENLAIGQRYINSLLGKHYYKGNLLKAIAAYNGGPGNLNTWLRKTDHGDDPLLFIESIPSRETRNYVERVLSNLWIYRMRLGQPTPSLDQLVAGEWPRYTTLDTSDDRRRVASR
ncbi:MAG: transglycosylase SLT domain-containing protein [Alphaproteobacteria bacterium]